MIHSRRNSITTTVNPYAYAQPYAMIRHHAHLTFQGTQATFQEGFPGQEGLPGNGENSPQEGCFVKKVKNRLQNAIESVKTKRFKLIRQLFALTKEVGAILMDTTKQIATYLLTKLKSFLKKPIEPNKIKRTETPEFIASEAHVFKKIDEKLGSRFADLRNGSLQVGFQEKELLETQVNGLSPQERDQVVLNLLMRREDSPLLGSELTLHQYLLNHYAEHVEDKELLLDSLIHFYRKGYYSEIKKAPEHEIPYDFIRRYDLRLNAPQNAEAVLKTYIEKLNEASDDKTFDNVSYLRVLMKSNQPELLAETILSLRPLSKNKKVCLKIDEVIDSFSFGIKWGKEQYQFWKKVAFAEPGPFGRPSMYKNSLLENLKSWERNLSLNTSGDDNLEEKQQLEAEKKWFARYCYYKWNLESFYSPTVRTHYDFMVEDCEASIPENLNKPLVKKLQHYVSQSLDGKNMEIFLIFDPEKQHDAELQYVMNQFVTFRERNPIVTWKTQTAPETGKPLTPFKFIASQKGKPMSFFIDLEVSDPVLNPILGNFSEVYNNHQVKNYPADQQAFFIRINDTPENTLNKLRSERDGEIEGFTSLKSRMLDGITLQ